MNTKKPFFPIFIILYCLGTLYSSPMQGQQRDMSYHQGITWTWLLGLYYDSLKNMIKMEKRKTYKIKLEEKLETFIEKVTKTFEKEVNQRGCIGNIAEIYDSAKPYLPKGAIAQAWSVSEILRIVSN